MKSHSSDFILKIFSFFLISEVDTKEFAFTIPFTDKFVKSPLESSDSVVEMTLPGV